MKQHPVNGQLTALPHEGGFVAIKFVNGDASYIGKDGKPTADLNSIAKKNLFKTEKACHVWIDGHIKKG